MFSFITSRRNCRGPRVLGFDLTGLIELRVHISKVRQAKTSLRISPPFACGFAPIRRMPVGVSSRSSASSWPFASNSSSGFCARIQLLEEFRYPGSSSHRRAALDVIARSLRLCGHRLSGGAVQPFGVRRTIMGQRGRVATPEVARLLLVFLIVCTQWSNVAAIA